MSPLGYRGARELGAVIGLCLVFAAGRARAEALDLPQTIALGADHGPGVATAGAPRAAYADARDAARVFFTLPPRLSVQLGPRFIDGAPRPEVLVGLYQDIPLRGLGGARADSADALLSYTAGAVARARLDAALRAGVAWTMVREAEDVLVLRRSATEGARELARITRARVDAGTLTPADRATADAEVALSAASELDAEGALVEARSELRLALTSSEDLPLRGDLRASDDTSADEASSIAIATTSHPSLVALHRRTIAYEHDAILQRAYQAPALTVGVSWSREGTGEQVVLGVLQLPLPFSRAGDYEAARTSAFADAERESEATERKRIEEGVRLALHERVHTREVRATFLTAVAALREAERLARIELDVGTSGLTPVLLARSRRITTEERLVRAYADVIRADLRFGHAIGHIPWRTP